MNRLEPDTDQLLNRASRGDGAARQQLLTRHRGRLRAMVAARLDRRLAARLDPSDVVQEALAEAWSAVRIPPFATRNGLFNGSRTRPNWRRTFLKATSSSKTPFPPCRSLCGVASAW
jgi:hypothetical protein